MEIKEMKFVRFVNDEDKQLDRETILKILKKAVSKKFISLLKKNGEFFTRELSYDIDNIRKYNTRTDRSPVDTDIEIHNYFNNGLYKKFGWKPRSEGVFVWNVEINEYAYLFFPIGDFKYIYSPEVKDLYVTTNKIQRKFDYTDEEYDKIIDTYKDSGIENVKHRVEVVFKCKEYYLVDYSLDIKFNEVLKEFEL